MEYTKRRNINRGYMKLEVWNEAMELLKLLQQMTADLPKSFFRLKTQILDAGQSISANIAEGYCRRTINEYLQYLNVSLGSSGELMTRVSGLLNLGLVERSTYNQFDECHFSMENKLLALVASLQKKRKDGTWQEELMA